MILVGDHAQLPAICHCRLSDIENYCQKHYVYNEIDWNSTTYYTLETLIKHVEDPKYCSFLNNPLSSTNGKRNFINFK